jgi:hypothetical protein
VIYESGSSGTVDNCSGRWNLTVDSDTVTIVNGIALDTLTLSAPIAVTDGTIGTLQLSSSASITNSTITAVTVSDQSPTLTGNTIGYITLSGGTPSITGNTLTNGMPIHIADPDVGTSGITGNSYDAADPWVYIKGTLDVSKTLGFIDTVLGKYVLNDKLSIASGATLTLASGVTVKADGGRDIFVYGRLEATGATVQLLHPASDLEVRNGGQLALTGGIVLGSGHVKVNDGAQATLTGTTFQYYSNPWYGGSPQVIYESGSSGTVDNCSGRWNLTVDSDTVTIVNGASCKTSENNVRIGTQIGSSPC